MAGAKDKEKGTALAVIERGAYPVLASDVASVVEAINENVGAGATLDEFSLSRIKVPGGDVDFFSLPLPDGPEAVATITGIVVFMRTTRAYWPSRDISGDPPQCSSKDGLVGHGDPGGECAACPLSQWGSQRTKDGAGFERGQACKQMRQLLLLLPDGGFLPYVLNLPPTSLKAWNDYAVRSLSSRGLPYYHVATTIGLEKDTGPSGKYNKATFALAGKLDDETLKAARDYSSGIRPIFESAPVIVRQDEAEGTGGATTAEDAGAPGRTANDEF